MDAFRAGNSQVDWLVVPAAVSALFASMFDLLVRTQVLSVSIHDRWHVNAMSQLRSHRLAVITAQIDPFLLVVAE
jgi:hypothetical protein